MLCQNSRSLLALELVRAFRFLSLAFSICSQYQFVGVVFTTEPLDAPDPAIRSPSIRRATVRQHASINTREHWQQQAATRTANRECRHTQEAHHCHSQHLQASYNWRAHRKAKGHHDWTEDQGGEKEAYTHGEGEGQGCGHCREVGGRGRGQARKEGCWDKEGARHWRRCDREEDLRLASLRSKSLTVEPNPVAVIMSSAI